MKILPLILGVLGLSFACTDSPRGRVAAQGGSGGLAGDVAAGAASSTGDASGSVPMSATRFDIGMPGGFGTLPQSAHVSVLSADGYQLFADGNSGVLLVGPVTEPPADGMLYQQHEGLSVARLASNGALQWSKFLPTSTTRFGVVIDESGNAYIAGSFRGQFGLDGHTISSTVNPGAVVYGGDGHGLPSLDIFLLKLNRAGKVEWLERFGGVADQVSHALLRGADGNLILVGNFMGKLDFGVAELLSSGGSTLDNSFIASIDLQGQVIATKQFEQGLAIYSATIDSQGDLIFAGLSPTASALFDDPAFAVPGGGWVLKLDPSWQPMWVKGLDAQLSPVLNQVVVDHEDDIVIAGDGYGHPSLFGTPIGDRAVVLAKLDPTGATIFASTYGADDLDFAASVAVLSDDSIAFTGGFYESIDFGGGELDCLEPHLYKSDVFVACVDAQGNHLWSLRAGGADSDSGFSIVATPNDTLVAAGEFANAADFGGGPVTTVAGPYVAWFEP